MEPTQELEKVEPKPPMEMRQLRVKKVNGVEYTEFTPDPKMRLFALSYFCDKEFRGKDPVEICELIGIGKNAYKKFLSYDPYFSEWLEQQRLLLGGRSRKHMLEMVGMEKALEGEFNFWKAMSIKEGVISADTLNIGAALPSNLGHFKDMSDEQLLAAENTILANLRGQTEPATIDLSEGPGGWEPESDPPGTSPLCEGSLVLASELGPDGECPIQIDESF